MARFAEQPERPLEEQVDMIARRFHERHEQLFHRRADSGPVAWHDMPESYQRRLLGTFSTLLRSGLIAPGPVIGWEHHPSE